MIRVLLVCCILGFPVLLQAQSTLTEGAALLFRNTKSITTIAEKNKLFIDLHFHLSKDRKQFVADGDDNKDFPFDAMVMPTDLNKDGNEEIFITFGNTYTSGNTGTSIVVFIKNAAGKYEQHLGFPGTTPDVLATMNKGYPDLLIGGPGFEFPAWRWNGTTYEFFRNVKGDDYEKLKKLSVEDASRTYMASIR